MQLPNLAHLVGVPLENTSLEALVAEYTARARELAQSAAVYTQVATDLRRLLERPCETEAEPPAKAAQTTRPAAGRQATIAAIRSEAARIDADAGDGYDPSADARSVAAVLRAKGGKQ